MWTCSNEKLEVPWPFAVAEPTQVLLRWQVAPSNMVKQLRPRKWSNRTAVPAVPVQLGGGGTSLLYHKRAPQPHCWNRCCSMCLRFPVRCFRDTCSNSLISPQCCVLWLMEIYRMLQCTQASPCLQPTDASGGFSGGSGRA